MKKWWLKRRRVKMLVPVHHLLVVVKSFNQSALYHSNNSIYQSYQHVFQAGNDHWLDLCYPFSHSALTFFFDHFHLSIPPPINNQSMLTLFSNHSPHNQSISSKIPFQSINQQSQPNSELKIDQPNTTLHIPINTFPTPPKHTTGEVSTNDMFCPNPRPSQKAWTNVLHACCPLFYTMNEHTQNPI